MPDDREKLKEDIRKMREGITALGGIRTSFGNSPYVGSEEEPEEEPALEESINSLLEDEDEDEDEEKVLESFALFLENKWVTLIDDFASKQRESGSPIKEETTQSLLDMKSYVKDCIFDYEF